jgi:cellobiose dehydrogenase (acceptor)
MVSLGDKRGLVGSTGQISVEWTSQVSVGHPVLDYCSRLTHVDKSIFAGDSSLLCSSDVVNAFQACTIGGNSAINAGLYFQPPASDWDEYFPEGWHSKDVQPAIDRLLKRQPAVTDYSTDGKFYLQSGYQAAKQWIVDSAGFADVSMSKEPNRKDRTFGRPVYNYIGGQRGGPTRTYLQSAISRPNFHLQTGARVKHIIHTNGTASGVVVETNDRETTIHVKPTGRVILSAGAILSPQILMYSGIGPKDILTKLSKASHTPYNASSWVVNSNVGEGLFDNPNTFIELSGPSVESYTYDYNSPVPEDKDLFLSKRSGPYTFASQTSVFWGYVPHDDGSKTGVQGTIDSSGYSGFTGNNTITLNIYGTSGMLSSGRVILSDDDKFIAGPSSDVYYSFDRDSRSIATFIHSIFQALPPSSPESPAAEGLTPLNIPRNSTLDDIHKYITTPSPYAVGSVQHWSSSCRIGACVDKDTKVIGTNNIHVIDASILSPLTVNPQFGVMVAGERGAEQILAALKN